MNTELTAKQIYEGMTGGEWEGSSKNNKVNCSGFWLAEVIEKNDRFESVANIEGITRAHNGTWMKGLDPEKYEECVKLLEAIDAEVVSEFQSDYELLQKIRPLLESVRIK